LLLTGLWWFLFSIPAIVTFQRRPAVVVARRALFSASMRRLWLSVRHISRLKDTFLFLICYMLHRNATTVFLAMGAFVVRTAPLSLSVPEASGAIVLWAFAGVIGMVFYRWLAGVLLRLRQKSHPDVNSSFGCKCVLLINLAILLVLTIWDMPFLGFYTTAELFIVVALAGFQSGSLTAFSRAFFTRLIPNHFESQFFALFEIVGESMVWPSLLIYSAILENTQNLRFGSVAVFFYILFSMIALVFVSVNRAQNDSVAFIEQAENNAYGRVQQAEDSHQKEEEEDEGESARSTE
jgi:MFS-type transporter involved in bile tolerance (Atg22 family)